MTVAKTSKKTRTAGEKIDDATIIAQVKMTLLYSKNVAGRVSKWPCPFSFIPARITTENGHEKEPRGKGKDRWTRDDRPSG